MKETTLGIKMIVSAVFLVFLLTAAGGAAEKKPGKETGKPGSISVLFIGNSFTGYHNMPGMVAALAAAEGKTLKVDEVIQYGQPLVHIAGSSYTRKKIQKKKWDYLVLQGGIHNGAYPSTHHNFVPPYQFRPLFGPLKDLSDLARKHHPGVRVIYFMPWAFKDGVTWIKGQSDTYADMQEKIRKNSLKFAKDLKLIVAPVGWAWNKVIAEKPNMDLFNRDWSHSSPRGAYLAACVFYATIYRPEPGPIDYYAGLPKKEALYLQKAAFETVLQTPNPWNPSTPKSPH